MYIVNFVMILNDEEIDSNSFPTPSIFTNREEAIREVEYWKNYVNGVFEFLDNSLWEEKTEYFDKEQVNRTIFLPIDTNHKIWIIMDEMNIA